MPRSLLSSLAPALLASLALTGAGCRAEAPKPDVPLSTVSASAFTDAFPVIDSVLLEATAEQPIVRVSGFEVDDQGRMLIADASERVIRVHSPSGRLLYSIGRSGDGPGEFRQPRFLIPLAGDSLIVGESSGRLHRFIGDSVVRTWQLDGVGFVSGIARGPSGEIVASAADGRESEVLRFDGDGKLVARSTVFSGVPVREQAADPRWLSFLQLWIASCGDKLVAAATLSDSVWSSFENGTSWAATSSRFGGYLPPQLPIGSAAGSERPFDWIKRYDVIQGLVCDDERIGVTFVRGIRNFGDPQVFVMSEGDRWTAYSQALPVLLLRRDTLFTILRPTSDTMWIGKHVRAR